jgi:hypothetical protein
MAGWPLWICGIPNYIMGQLSAPASLLLIPVFFLFFIPKIFYQRAYFWVIQMIKKIVFKRIKSIERHIINFKYS